jgi:hypothetical protein
VWGNVLDLALILWVVRVPVCALVVGIALLVLVPQAQDLLVELIESPWHIALYMVLLFFVWASTTHYAARLLLDTDARFRAHAALRASPFLSRQEVLIPRLLGSLTFVAVLLSAERSIRNLPVIDDPGLVPFISMRLRWLELTIAVVLALFIVYVRGRTAVATSAVVSRLESKTMFVTRMLRRIGLITPPGASNLGPLLLILVFLLCAGVLAVDASRVAAWFPRGLAVPVLLGAWLPFLSFLSALGRQYKAPLIVGGVVLAAGLTYVIGDNHSVRRIDAMATVGKSVEAQLTLNRAVHLWMDANGCAANPANCPRPIIVAAAGGASRAGFFTASVIGYFLDLKGPGHPQIDATAIRNRLFAISGVSGGSVGAVMTVAAMARAGASMKQPCVEANPELWYGRVITVWQDCLEALTAGDFLTPVAVGLIFRDNLQFGWWADRAAIIEQSWENRFTGVMKSDDNWSAKCPGDLRCPFLTARPQDKHWLPLLVLNGVSAETGRRIVTTPLALDYEPHDDCPVIGAMTNRNNLLSKSRNLEKPAVSSQASNCRIFLETARFHDMLKNTAQPDWIGRFQRLWVWDHVREQLPWLFAPLTLDDVRLSTAAHNSARFPIVSPPGSIRNRAHHIVDRIVDGGYMENYGALGALELAQAVRAIESKLAPFVLVVSNDPDENPDLNPAEASDAALLTDVIIPLEAVSNTRTARGRLALAQLEAQLETAMPGCGANTAHIQVWPQFDSLPGGDTKVSRPVSMSWWLSRPIQVHLHQQIEGEKSGNRNQDETASAWQAFGATSQCAEKEP